MAAKRAFQGVKVADFTWVGVGPLTIKYLADHGAEVIHVESALRPELLRVTPPFKDGRPGLNRSAYNACFNDNKYGLALNLQHPRAGEVLRRLVAWADVVAESFSPGTMARLGMAYEDLAARHPGLIMFSTSQQGQTGPHARIAAYGTQLVSLAGFTDLTGWPDRTPTGPYGPYTDVLAPALGATALAAALLHRRHTGQGTHIDLSQLEVGANYLGPAVLDYTANGRVASRQGNRCPEAAPHGVYPCRGEDRWCAIAVGEEDEWRRLCAEMGRPELADDPRFSTLPARKENEDALDEMLAAWTSTLPAEEVMSRLQAAGIAAGVAQTGEDLHGDPQLAHRHFFWELEHPEIGRHHYEAPPFHLSETPAELTKPGPSLGEDSEYVCTTMLQMPDDLFVELLGEGVFA